MLKTTELPHTDVPSSSTASKICHWKNCFVCSYPLCKADRNKQSKFANARPSRNNQSESFRLFPPALYTREEQHIWDADNLWYLFPLESCRLLAQKVSYRAILQSCGQNQWKTIWECAVTVESFSIEGELWDFLSGFSATAKFNRSAGLDALLSILTPLSPDTWLGRI